MSSRSSARRVLEGRDITGPPAGGAVPRGTAGGGGHGAGGRGGGGAGGPGHHRPASRPGRAPGHRRGRPAPAPGSVTRTGRVIAPRNDRGLHRRSDGRVTSRLPAHPGMGPPASTSLSHGG